MSKKIRILVIHRQQTAVGYYRQHNPSKILQKLGYEVEFDPKTCLPALKPRPEDWLERRLNKFDLLLCDRGTTWREVGAQLRGFVHNSEDCRMIVDFDDDFLNVPPWNPASRHFQPGKEIYESGIGHLRLAEMTTVSTKPIAEMYVNLCHQIRLAPNLIDPAEWENHPVDPDRAADEPLRIFYGGAGGHYGDLDAVRPGLEAFLRNPPRPVRFICFGTIPRWLHDLSRDFPGRVIPLPWWEFEDYPAAVAWGGFDMAIAPLAQHRFNLAKSNIKWLESAIQRIPFICSNIGPYSEIPEGCAIRLDNTPFDWEEGLRTVATDSDLRQSLVESAREEVLNKWVLDNGLQIWQDIVEATLARPRIETLEDTRLPTERGEIPPPAPAAP